MAESEEQTRRAASRQIHAAIDRVEDNQMAVLLVGDDEKTQIDLPLSFLPEGAQDGDHLRITISIDKESREAAATRVKKLQDKLAQTGGAQDQKDFKL
jgi:tRNA threonylcarbamoyladenosine modification (KEOPS) complex Cgi121 subunit